MLKLRKPILSAALLSLALPWAAWGGDTQPTTAPTTAPAASDIGNWPQWRGPGRNDISPDTALLKQWPAEGPPLAWRAKGLGSGFSSVAIAKGKILTMGDLPDGAYVICLSEQGGAQLWSTKIGQPGGGQGYPGPRGTPAIDGDNVYALGQFGDLVCLDLTTGKQNWHKNLQADMGGQMMSGWGYAESPLVLGDLLYCTPGGSGGTIAALNKSTGAIVWRSTDMRDTASYSSIVPAKILDAQQLVQLTGEHVFAVAPDSGKLLWSATRHGNTAVIPTPVVADDQVFVTSGYDAGCALFKITGAAGSYKAEEVYQNKNMKNHHGGVVLIDGYIYGCSDARRGSLACVDFKTGKLLWDDPAPGKGSLTFADGQLYVRNEAGPGTIYLVPASSTGFSPSGHFDPPDRSKAHAWPHPVVTGGKLYLRDQDTLLCYDVRAK